MAKVRGDYRTINPAFWDDPDLQEQLEPMARLAYCVLRTCQDYSFAGIYRYYLSTFRARAGLTDDRGWTDGQALLLIDALEKAGVVMHDQKQSVVWIIDGLAGDPSCSLSHTKQREGVLTQLRSLPKTHLLLHFMHYYDLLNLPDASDLAAKARLTAKNCVESELSGQVEAFPHNFSMDLLTPLNSTPLNSTPLTLSPPPATTGFSSSPAVPATTGLGDQDRVRGKEADAVARRFIAAAGEMETGGDQVAQVFLDEAERGISEFYERQGGRWTPTRRRDLFSRLDRYDIRAVLAALEIYCDKYFGNKSQKYLAGIAFRLDRSLKSPEGRKEFDRELAENRRVGTGVFARAMEVLDERSA